MKTIKIFFISIILLIFISITPCYADCNVACVGNSMAVLMNYFLGIEDDTIEFRNSGKNCVGGSYIWSNFNQTINFPERAKLYDYIIIWWGTNELVNNSNPNLVEYISYLDKYIKAIKNINSMARIFIMEIPKFPGKEVEISCWNNTVKKLCELDKVNYIALPNEYTLIDTIHIGPKAYKDIWEELKYKFNIKQKADYETNPDRLILTRDKWKSIIVSMQNSAEK